MINWINETMQTFTGVGVLALSDNNQLIFFREKGKLNANSVRNLGGVEHLTVEYHRVNCSGYGVDKARGALFGAEANSSGRAKQLASLS